LLFLIDSNLLFLSSNPLLESPIIGSCIESSIGLFFDPSGLLIVSFSIVIPSVGGTLGTFLYVSGSRESDAKDLLAEALESNSAVLLILFGISRFFFAYFVSSTFVEPLDDKTAADSCDGLLCDRPRFLFPSPLIVSLLII